MYDKAGIQNRHILDSIDLMSVLHCLELGDSPSDLICYCAWCGDAFDTDYTNPLHSALADVYYCDVDCLATHLTSHILKVKRREKV